MTGDCILAKTCPVEGGFLAYHPSIPANAFMVAAFAALLPVTCVLGYRFHTLGFTANFATGVALELLGFVGRLLLGGAGEGAAASRSYFALYLLGTVLGPTLLASAAFVVLPHVLAVYGVGVSAVRGSHVGLLFFSIVVLVVVLEIIGVAFMVFGVNQDAITQSTRVLLAGLVIQGIGLVLFMGFQFWFNVTLNRSRTRIDPQHAEIYRSSQFKRFLMVLHLSAFILLICTILRIAEAATGLSGALAQNEAATTVVHGALPLIVCVLLSVCSPGAVFGDVWAKTTPRYISQHFWPAGLGRNDANPYRAPNYQQQQQREQERLAQFSVQRVAPRPLAPNVSPYELYPQPFPVTRPSPTKSSHTGPSRHLLVDDNALW